MHEKKDLLGRIGEYLDLPRDLLPGGFTVLLSGERELCVRGRAFLRTYSEKQIVFALEEVELCVEGEGLFCRELSAENIVIIGTVRALFLKRGEKDAT